MYDATHYSNKIPSTVRNAMRSFTHQECQLVKRRTRGATGNGKANMCHQNVDHWVNKKGGQVFSGWKLVRDNQLTKKGIWLWIFHSVWLTPENKLADTTLDPSYGSATQCTFWPDKKRHVDLTDGKSFNNIVVFESAKAANKFGNFFKKQIKRGQVYWTTFDMKHIRRVDEHNGLYRLLGGYPNNLHKMETEYDCKIAGNRLVFNNPLQRDNPELLFDYGVEYR